MTQTSIIAPRSITSLQTALGERVIKVEAGQLMIVMGERAVIVSAGQEITINRGTMHAIANLTLSSSIVIDSLDPITMAKENTVFASADGQVYMTSRGPAAQITLSLYSVLLEDLGHEVQQALAA